MPEIKRNPSYKAIVVDLDGTLLHSDKTISERTLTAIQNWQEAGGKFIVATARPDRTMEVFCKDIQFDAAITYNGARVRHGSDLLETYITPTSARFILEELSKISGIVISIEAASGAYANQEIPEWSPEVVPSIVELADREHIYKILASLPNKLASEIYLDLPDNVISSIAEGKLLQIMDKNATKWNGVLSALQTLDIATEETIYFGDDQDDIEPIEKAGLGIAMGNAIPAVKEAADLVIDTNDEDGVAHVMEIYGGKL